MHHAKLRGVAIVAAVWLATAATARADAGEQARHVIRIATVAPDGSSWAREMKAFEREVRRETKGKVAIKFYFGGVAGNEKEVAQRIAKGQLDGTASGGVMCARLMPSMNVLKLPGTYADRNEAKHVTSQLAPVFEAEAQAAGFTVLGFVGLGKKVIFSRQPIETLEQLRSTKVWRWELDDFAIRNSERMGLDIVPLPLDRAAHAFDDERVDAFFSVPTAALAFQWYAQAPYIIDLDFEYLTGCLVIANSAMDELSSAEQHALRDHASQFLVRVDALVQRQDEMLLGGIFQKQGLELVTVRKQFRDAVARVTARAQTAIEDDELPRELVDQVKTMLSEYRERGELGARRSD